MKKLLILCLVVLASNGVSAEVLTGTDELAQMPYWELRTEAMSFRLVQRLPDQTRAYFSGRGFGKKDVDYIAGYCVFQSIFTNTASADSHHTLQHDLSEWQVDVNGRVQSLIMREDWQKIWQLRKAEKKQQIAFEWSLLPTRQQYQPADYNWGMTFYKVPHGETFDLNLSWKLNGQTQKTTIKKLQCARDVYIPPVDQQAGE